MIRDKTATESLIASLVDQLLEESKKNTEDGNCDYSNDTHEKLERIKNPEPVWRIETSPVDIKNLDRKANMLGGNPFTSNRHPWPSNDAERPYYPLIQINLQQISELSGKQFGYGLMQVWLDVSDSDLPSLIRFINPGEMNETLQNDSPSLEDTKEIDESRSWFGISEEISFKFLGFMLPHFGDGDIEWNYSRDLSDKEVAILDRIEHLSKEHGYRSLKENWLLGYPDRGSGSPAGRHEPEPNNFIQFRTPEAFPFVDISIFANLFYSEFEGDVSFFFDWNG